MQENPISAQPASALLDEAWTAVAGATERPEVTVTGPADVLPSRLSVGGIATATVVTALRAAAALDAHPTARFHVDRAQLADAVRSERAFRVDGLAAGASFAPLSRFWRTADGFVRTHANYPWHRIALLRSLDLSVSDDADAVSRALAERPATEVEEGVFTHGGVAARVRTAREWNAHPQGIAVREEPLVAHAVFGAAEPRVRPPATSPVEGVRVLDLTRVIAGPVCTRFLGALGADVLRIDPPDHDDIPPGMYADTLLGKRSAMLDLRQHDDRLHVLLERADVLVCGYRPGTLDRYGLTDDELAEQHPGLVVVRLAAWGHTGPWRPRRGFDSIVQAAVGIADVESGADGTPGVLPCQLLDHGTGYLAAAAVLDGLRRQRDSGGTVVRGVSLARTAAWLLDAPRHTDVAEPAEPTQAWTTQLGSVTAVVPPGSVDGRPLRWPEPASRFLADEPAWR